MITVETTTRVLDGETVLSTEVYTQQVECAAATPAPAQEEPAAEPEGGSVTLLQLNGVDDVVEFGYFPLPEQWTLELWLVAPQEISDGMAALSTQPTVPGTDDLLLLVYKDHGGYYGLSVNVYTKGVVRCSIDIGSYYFPMGQRLLEQVVVSQRLHSSGDYVYDVWANGFKVKQSLAVAPENILQRMQLDIGSNRRQAGKYAGIGLHSVRMWDEALSADKVQKLYAGEGVSPLHILQYGAGKEQDAYSPNCNSGNCLAVPGGATLNDRHPMGTVIVFEGDSLTAGQPGPGLAFTHGLVSQRDYILDDFRLNVTAVGGSQLQDCLHRVPLVASYFNPNHRERSVVLWAGSNDLVNGKTVDETMQLLADCVAAYNYHDLDVTVLTLIPRYNLPEALRLAANERIRSATAGANVVVDLDATVLGDPLVYYSTAYYEPDRVHLNEAGQRVVAEAVAGAYSIF